MPPPNLQLPEGMAAITFTLNAESAVISIAVSVPYSRPFGSYIFLVRCNYNPDIDDCLENKLTRDPQFETWESKCDILTTFIDEHISKFKSISPPVTGLTFRSRLAGPPYICTYEDLSHSLLRINIIHVRFHPLVSKSKLSVTLTDIFGKFPRYDIADLNGIRYIFRRHDFSWDNNNFKYEIIAHEKGVSSHPHVLPESMLVKNDAFEVEGLLLPWCELGSIDYLLRHQGNKITSNVRLKWVSQISHALKGIHSSQLSHGNLNRRTIFVDKNWDLHLTGFVLGLGYRTALGGEATPERLLAWDVLCLGKVMEDLVAIDLERGKLDTGPSADAGDTMETYLQLASRCSDVMTKGNAWDILDSLARLAHCGCIISTNQI